MLFIVYFFYKNESHLYSPNEFLFRIWQKKYLNKFRVLPLCWPIFFEIGGLSSSGSSRAWIPIFRAQETCLITKYLVNSSCEGKHELSFWGINQRTCEITRFSAWVAEAPLLGSFLQRQAGRKWCRSALAGAEQTLTHSKGLGSVPRTSRVHFEKLHRSSNQGIVAKCTHVPALPSVSAGLPAPLGSGKALPQPPRALLARVVPTSVVSLPLSSHPVPFIVVFLFSCTSYFPIFLHFLQFPCHHLSEMALLDSYGCSCLLWATLWRHLLFNLLISRVFSNLSETSFIFQMPFSPS